MWMWKVQTCCQLFLTFTHSYIVSYKQYSLLNHFTFVFKTRISVKCQSKIQMDLQIWVGFFLSPDLFWTPYNFELNPFSFDFPFFSFSHLLLAAIFNLIHSNFLPFQTDFQGSKFIFDFGSTCATRCKFLGALPKF